MLTKLYIAIWAMWAVLGFGGLATGMMSGYPLVFFGMAAFGLIYFGMMFVLPLTITHPEIAIDNGPAIAPAPAKLIAADERPGFCVTAPHHV